KFFVIKIFVNHKIKIRKTVICNTDSDQNSTVLYAAGVKTIRKRIPPSIILSNLLSSKITL
ncbi:MAG: hypothetical protein D6734_11145, partial [Candidatus Schekmanbacteria bacterium]